jgi:hypothetical protein
MLVRVNIEHKCKINKRVVVGKILRKSEGVIFRKEIKLFNSRTLKLK